jgi:hypothetical protein
MTLSLTSLPDPTEADPSCERYGTKPSLSGKPGWHPEGAHRTGREPESQLYVLRRRGQLCHFPNTPLSLTRFR